MSAVRRTERRAHRDNLSSPYARPLKSTKAQPSKKSLWSLSGLVSFLNPFGGKGDSEDSDAPGLSDGEIEQGSPPRRFSPLQQPLPPPPLPPPQQSSNSSWPSVMNSSAGSSHVAQSSPDQPFSLNTLSPVPSGPSLAKNLEPVTRFLVEKAGQPLNEFEAAGIVDYIQKNVQGSAFVPDKPEPFRFSVSPSRGASPNVQDISSTQTPRKTLSRNPNGVYRWQGAGSSRPRNRYQSPGFAPRPQQHRIKLSPPKTPQTTDTKRRRVGDEAVFSTPEKPAVPSTSTSVFLSPVAESPVPPSGNAIEPPTISLNGKPAISSLPTPAPPVTPKSNGIQPRIRTVGLAMKPTTPAIPSPLRQTWKESDSPPQTSPLSRPTRAADFMTELIKEVTPTKKPDVSNPYQTASPVKLPAPARKPVVKRPRPSAKLAEKSKEHEPEMSAQAIIEATVPKGTKRSRPEVEKHTRGEEAPNSETPASALNGCTHTIRSVCSVVETRDEENPSKRRKTPPAKPSYIVQEVDEAGAKAIVYPTEIIEPADGPAQTNGKLVTPLPMTTPSPPSATKSLLGAVKTCAPKEPSKLRYSFHADKVEVMGANVVPAPSRPSLFSPPPVLKVKLSAKEQALAMDIDELPEYTFSVGETSSSAAGPSFSATRSAVISLAVTSLPIYEFTPVIAPVRTMNGFNWTAAGIKAPATSAQTWSCSLCGLQNPAEAKEKCTICDAPRQAPMDSSSPTPACAPTTSTPVVTAPPPAPPRGFDWSAAGITPPPKIEQGAWTCSVCLLFNPASAADKCFICESPR